MKVKVLDERFVAHRVSEYSVTPQRTAVASSVHFDLLSANSFGGGGGGGSIGGGSDSNNGNEGNEENEGTEGNEGNENDENNEESCKVSSCSIDLR